MRNNTKTHKMKKTILLTMAALFSAASFAQSENPVYGFYKLVSLEAQGRTVSDLPVRTFRNYAEGHTLILWEYPREDRQDTRLSWRFEVTSTPEDPFCVKTESDGSDGLHITWFNTSKGFYDFPAGIWVTETWKKAINEEFLSRFSAVVINHKAKNKLLGSWKLVARQANDIYGAPTIPGGHEYKIYGEKDCLSLVGSMYNVEQGNRAFLKPFQWLSENEFVEAGVNHKVTFETPTKMLVEYNDEKNGKMTETWIRHDIPEPLSSTLLIFKY